MDHPAGRGGVEGEAAGHAPPPAAALPRRHLVVCAEDTPESAAACEWALQNFYREGDIVHMTYVVKCLQPTMEVFHGLPGTAYSFTAPAGQHREHELLAHAKARLEKRFLPLLRPHLVPYQLHLYVERCDVGLQRVAELLMQDIEQRDAAVVILSAHNKPGSSAGIGSVAEFLSKNCHRPLAVVRPHSHGQ